MLTEGTRGAPALETPARGPHARPARSRKR